MSGGVAVMQNGLDSGDLLRWSTLIEMNKDWAECEIWTAMMTSGRKWSKTDK